MRRFTTLIANPSTGQLEELKYAFHNLTKLPAEVPVNVSVGGLFGGSEALSITPLNFESLPDGVTVLENPRRVLTAKEAKNLDSSQVVNERPILSGPGKEKEKLDQEGGGEKRKEPKKQKLAPLKPKKKSKKPKKNSKLVAALKQLFEGSSSSDEEKQISEDSEKEDESESTSRIPEEEEEEEAEVNAGLQSQVGGATANFCKRRDIISGAVESTKNYVEPAYDSLMILD